jgi:hypothetical protein
LVSRPLQSPPERPPRATARGTGHIHFDTMLLHRLKQPAPVAGILRRRSAHFLTWPPTVPARPHPSTELHAAYGLGDWFVASLVSSVVSWPVAFAVDSLWGSFLLPHVQSIREGKWVQEAEAASLVPKALGSYLGALLWHLARYLLCDDRRRREAGGGRWLGRAGGAAVAAALSVALTLAVVLALATTLALGPTHTHTPTFTRCRSARRRA